MTYLAQISFELLFWEWSFLIKKVIVPVGLDIHKVVWSEKFNSFQFKGLVPKCYFGTPIGLLITLE